MSQWKSETTQVVMAPERRARPGLSGLGAGEAQALLAGCMEIIPIPIAVVEVDEACRVVHANAAWKEVAGRHGSRSALWEDQDTVEDALRRVSGSGVAAHLVDVEVPGDERRWRADAYPVPVDGRPRPQVLFCLRRMRVEAPPQVQPPTPDRPRRSTPPLQPTPHGTSHVRTLVQADNQRLQEELSGRELEVAELVASGMHNHAIARRLNISKTTVASHVTRILQKLGYTSRAQVAAWVVERRLRDAQASG
ncbi:MAG TPA: helix-turn-helix transcriptional regulator [Candidatus Dormibacteraeota bacterium]|jgi:DNA-binding CsgD family transcriptional regulator|nr:helix-turn-helix transcriptional regulator [Candidatus Dormibacteraeota bacterium]